MTSEAYVPNEVIACADDETKHLSVVEDIKLPPGAEATRAFMHWSERVVLYGNPLPLRVDYHAEGADWVYQYTSVGRQALATEVSVEAA